MITDRAMSQPPSGHLRGHLRGAFAGHLRGHLRDRRAYPHPRFTSAGSKAAVFGGSKQMQLSAEGKRSLALIQVGLSLGSALLQTKAPLGLPFNRSCKFF